MQNYKKKKATALSEELSITVAPPFKMSILKHQEEKIKIQYVQCKRKHCYTREYTV